MAMNIIDVLNRFVSKRTTWENMTCCDPGVGRFFSLVENGFELKIECLTCGEKEIAVWSDLGLVGYIVWNANTILYNKDEMAILDLIVR